MMRLPPTTPSPVKIMASRAMSSDVDSRPPEAKMFVIWNGTRGRGALNRQ